MFCYLLGVIRELSHRGWIRSFIGSAVAGPVNDAIALGWRQRVYTFDIFSLQQLLRNATILTAPSESTLGDPVKKTLWALFFFFSSSPPPGALINTHPQDKPSRVTNRCVSKQVFLKSSPGTQGEKPRGVLFIFLSLTFFYSFRHMNIKQISDIKIQIYKYIYTYALHTHTHTYIHVHRYTYVHIHTFINIKPPPPPPPKKRRKKKQPGTFLIILWGVL